MLNWTRSLFVLCTLSIGFTAFAADESVSLQIQLESRNQMAPLSQISVENPSVQTAAEVAQIIEQRTQTSAIPVLVTTDRADLLLELNQQSSAPLRKDVYVAPYGQVVAEKQIPKWRQAFDSYGANIKSAANNDRIGLAIMTITIVNETFLWFHATNMSTLAQSSNLIYSVLLIGTFGIDKDGWARTAKPIQKFFKKITGNADAIWNRKDPRDIANRFASSFVLSLGLNTLRFGLLSMDSLLTGSLELSGMKIQTLIALAGTFSSFAWSEHIALIDQKTAPAARFFFSRVQESRALLLGMVAATVYLLHPETFGYLPWFALGTSGVAGIVVYLNSDHILKWIDGNDRIQKMMSKLSKIHWLFPNGGGLSALSCNAVHRGSYAH